MFDFEKEEQATMKAFEDGDWEQITDAHATAEEVSGRATARAATADPHAIKSEARKELFEDFYENNFQRRRQRTQIDAFRYALIALGGGILAYVCSRYGINWLAWILGCAGGAFAIVSSYGFGIAREMGR